jgi:hypothetical protein
MVYGLDFSKPIRTENDSDGTHTKTQQHDIRQQLRRKESEIFGHSWAGP